MRKLSSRTKAVRNVMETDCSEKNILDVLSNKIKNTVMKHSQNTRSPGIPIVKFNVGAHSGSPGKSLRLKIIIFEEFIYFKLIYFQALPSTLSVESLRQN